MKEMAELPLECRRRMAARGFESFKNNYTFDYLAGRLANELDDLIGPDS